MTHDPEKGEDLRRPLVVRGATILAVVLDLIKEHDSADRDVRGLLVDHETELRALLEFALSQNLSGVATPRPGEPEPFDV